MEDKKPFQTRVRDVIIEYAKKYKEYFVDYDYLILSDRFQNADYYIVKAHETNFRHLTGVSTSLTAKEFFEKAYNATLTEEDFSISKKGVQDKEAKGTVRRKINALPNMIGIFNQQTLVEEDYSHNSIRCSFIANDKKSTVGFSQTNPTVPLTLLFGDKIDLSAVGHLSLVLRKKEGDDLFSEIIVGNINVLKEKLPQIEELLTDELKKHP